MRMKINNVLVKICNKSIAFLKEHGATILSVVGVGGVVLTSVLTTKSTIKATDKLNEVEDGTKDTKLGLEIASYYIPPILAGIGTASCILGANALNKKHQAMLTSAYAMINQSYNAYRQKNIEENGEEANKKVIESSIVQDDEEYQQQMLIENPCGKIILYDVLSGNSVVCYEGDAYRAEYELNKEFVESGHLLLNSFWGMFGLPQNNYGKEFGWSTSSNLNWIDFNHTVIEEDDGGMPIFEIEVPSPNKLEWWEM